MEKTYHGSWFHSLHGMLQLGDITRLTVLNGARFGSPLSRLWTCLHVVKKPSVMCFSLKEDVRCVYFGNSQIAVFRDIIGTKNQLEVDKSRSIPSFIPNSMGISLRSFRSHFEQWGNLATHVHVQGGRSGSFNRGHYITNPNNALL